MYKEEKGFTGREELHRQILALMAEEGKMSGDIGREIKRRSASLSSAAWLETAIGSGEKTFRLLETLKRYEIRMVFMDDPEYPEKLMDLEDPPAVLFLKGKAETLKEESVSIVGSRKAVPYGIRAAYEIAGACAKNHRCVVSGLALGIDAAAHRGALDAGGTTIAVLGCGIEKCYPKSNAWLMSLIETSGCVISEFLPGTPPLGWCFAKRNRIISALSSCLVVAQAGVHSGSLITARNAAEEGRDVFIVPGSIFDGVYLGSHRLIQEGANVLTSVDMLFTEKWVQTELDLTFRPRVTSESEKKAQEREKSLEKIRKEKIKRAGDFAWLYEKLDDFGKDAQSISAETDRDPVEVQMGLSFLELEGLIRREGSRIIPI